MYTIEAVTQGEFHIVNSLNNEGYAIFLRHNNAKRVLAYPQVFNDPLEAMMILERMQGGR